MIDIPVTTSAANSAQTNAPVSNVTPVAASVTDVPDKIQQLVRQIQISATVAAAPSETTITLNSVLGNLVLQLPQLAGSEQQKLTQQLLSLLQSQKPLTVIVQPGNPPTQATLLLPSTPNPQNTTQVGTQSLPSALQSALQPALTPRLMPVPGLMLSAVVLPPNPASAPTPGNPLLTPGGLNLPSVPAGTTAPPTQATGAQPPTAVPPQATPTPPPATTSPIPVAVSSSAAVPENETLAALLKPGNTVTLQINTVIATPSSANAPPPSLAPNQILATVVDNGPNGQVLFKAGTTTLFSGQPVELPVGSTVLLTVAAAKPTTLLPVTLPDTQSFASLQQVLAALNQIDPQIARQVIADAIPQPGAALPGALLFFMSAVKQGNVRSWLGDDAIDALMRAGKFEVLDKLSGELGGMGQTAQDAVVGEWKSYPLPFFNNPNFQALSFYVHDHGQRQGDAQGIDRSGVNHTRFVIEVRMSVLGMMQIDGFVQPKKLDLIVRSEQALPEGMHQDLRQTYLRSLTAIDYAGSLNFQVGRQHWLVIQPQGAQAVITT